MTPNYAEIFGNCLKTLSVDRVDRDDAGDWRISVDGHTAMARIFLRPVPFVYLWTGVVQSVDADCVSELNRLNCNSAIAHFVYEADGGHVFAAADLLVSGLNTESLGSALTAIHTISEQVAPMLGAMFTTDGA